MKHRKLTSPLEIKDFTQISGTLPARIVSMSLLFVSNEFNDHSETH